MTVHCPAYDPVIGWYITITGPNGPKKRPITSPLFYYYCMGVKPPVGAQFSAEDYIHFEVDLMYQDDSNAFDDPFSDPQNSLSPFQPLAVGVNDLLTNTEPMTLGDAIESWPITPITPYPSNTLPSTSSSLYSTQLPFYPTTSNTPYIASILPFAPSSIYSSQPPLYPNTYNTPSDPSNTLPFSSSSVYSSQLPFYPTLMLAVPHNHIPHSSTAMNDNFHTSKDNHSTMQLLIDAPYCKSSLHNIPNTMSASFDDSYDMELTYEEPYGEPHFI